MSWLPLALVGCTPQSAEAPLRVTADHAGELRASFEPGEVVVSAPWPGAPEVGLSLVGWSGEGVVPSREGGRTTYAHDGLTEWWERGPKGLEQGFVVEEAPAVGPLVLELALRGAEAVVDADGRSATLLPEPGGRLRYEGLRAWDAEGTDLPAWMEATAGGLSLVVDTEGAVGAITVDPVLPGATWSAEGNQVAASFGGSVASAGDVNGDGYDDVIVGAMHYDGRQPDEGAAVVYLGSAAGLSAVSAWSAEGNQGSAGFGGSVASAGDVNGDGFGDVVVGAPGFHNGHRDEGAAYLYLGSAAGLMAAPAWTGEGNQDRVHFGGSVASAGDVNGDGYGDVVVGANWYSDGQGREGAAFLYLGSAAGLSLAPAWTGEGNQSLAYLGQSVASAGDVNGDGYGDVVVGAPGYNLGRGAAFVYMGSAVGLSAVPSWVAEYPEFGNFGAAVASAGDVNGDGYGDVVVGVPGYPDGLTGEGGALLYLGSAAGLSAVPAWTAEGDRPSGSFGYSVASAGDVNGDGYGDVVVGARAYEEGQTDEGAAFVYLGSTGGLSVVHAATLEGNQEFAQFGYSVASAGDTDGDGLDDLVVGAPNYESGQTSEGAAFVYADLTADRDGDGSWDLGDLCPDLSDPAQLDGDGDGIGNACDEPELTVVGVVSSGALVSLVATGVGPGEVVRFGGAVGGGGAGPCPAALGGLCLDLGPGAVDLGTAVGNGSGEASLPLRVPAAIQPNGTYVVQAAIRRGVGGADSVKAPLVVLDGAVLDWDADGLVDVDEAALGTDPRSPDTDGDGLPDGEEVWPHFDPLVGDTDGDGVLDGADQCWAGDDAADGDVDGVRDACDTCPTDADPGQVDQDEDGLGDVCDGPVLSAAVWTGDGNQASALFGGSVASAGDVNGDGYGDVVVGAYRYDNGLSDEGAAFVYLGSAAGLSAVQAWRGEGNQANAFFGGSVASAGDVNGDGYGDVVVGAFAYDDGQPDEGAAALYLGSAAGLSAAPSWSAEGSTANASFGASVASAGDVNGDGYDDVVVGVPGYDDGQLDFGAAVLYLGSAAGLSAAPSWSAEGNQARATFGTSVASAGDVNGDGYGDVVVGVPGYDDGENSEGAAVLYLGSAVGLSAVPAWSAEGDQASALFGTSVASAGDVNGDGYGDVVVGAEGYENGQGQYSEGAAFLYLGSAAGLSAAPAWTAEGNQPYVEFGASVASAGDVNGDGFGDVVIGVPGFGDMFYYGYYQGAAVLYLGSATGLARAPGWAREGQGSSSFGASVASAGDVDGDGRSDLLVGAEGRAWLYLGQTP